MTERREPRVLLSEEIDAARERAEQHLAEPTFAPCEIAQTVLDLIETLRDQCGKTTEAEQQLTAIRGSVGRVKVPKILNDQTTAQRVEMLVQNHEGMSNILDRIRRVVDHLTGFGGKPLDEAVEKTLREYDSLKRKKMPAYVFAEQLASVLGLPTLDDRLLDNVLAHVISLVSDRNQSSGEVGRLTHLINRVSDLLGFKDSSSTDVSFLEYIESASTKLALWRDQRNRLMSYLQAEYGSSVGELKATGDIVEAVKLVLNYWQTYGEGVAGQICAKLDEMMIDGDDLVGRFNRLVMLLQEAEKAKDDLSRLRRDIGDALGLLNPTGDEHLIEVVRRTAAGFKETQENLGTEVEHSDGQETILREVQARINAAGVRCLDDFLVVFGVETLISQRDKLRDKLKAAHETISRGFGSTGLVDKRKTLSERIEGVIVMHGVAHRSTHEVADAMLRQYETWDAFQRRVGELRGMPFRSPSEVLPYIEGMFEVLKLSHEILDRFGIKREPPSLLERIETLGKRSEEYKHQRDNYFETARRFDGIVQSAHAHLTRAGVKNVILDERVEIACAMIQTDTGFALARVKERLGDYLTHANGNVLEAIDRLRAVACTVNEHHLVGGFDEIAEMLGVKKRTPDKVVKAVKFLLGTLDAIGCLLCLEYNGAKEYDAVRERQHIASYASGVVRDWQHLSRVYVEVSKALDEVHGGAFTPTCSACKRVREIVEAQQ